MNCYKITHNTLAIIPCENNMSLVYEGEKIFVVNMKPNLIIAKNCINNGSSLLGRQKSSEKLTGNSYKVPIVIKEEEKIIFFPTSSPRLKSVSWINFNNISTTYYDYMNRLSVVVFLNGTRVEFNVSLNIINNQMFRATRLEHMLWRSKVANK